MAASTTLLQFLLMVVAGWLQRQQAATIDYLKAENRLLRTRLGGRRIVFTDAERRQLAEKASLDFSYISKLENGRLSPPAADTVVRLAEVLGCLAEDLLSAAKKMPTGLSSGSFGGAARSISSSMRAARRPRPPNDRATAPRSGVGMVDSSACMPCAFILWYSEPNAWSFKTVTSSGIS